MSSGIKFDIDTTIWIVCECAFIFLFYSQNWWWSNSFPPCPLFLITHTHIYNIYEYMSITYCKSIVSCEHFRIVRCVCECGLCLLCVESYSIKIICIYVSQKEKKETQNEAKNEWIKFFSVTRSCDFVSLFSLLFLCFWMIQWTFSQKYFVIHRMCNVIWICFLILLNHCIRILLNFLSKLFFVCVPKI